VSLGNRAELSYFIKYNYSGFFGKERNNSLSSQERVRVRSKKEMTPPQSSPMGGGNQGKEWHYKNTMSIY
jgi:hypothetical protein